MSADRENHECGDSVRRILSAAHFAAEKHAQQKRKGENGRALLQSSAGSR